MGPLWYIGSFAVVKELIPVVDYGSLPVLILSVAPSNRQARPGFRKGDENKERRGQKQEEQDIKEQQILRNCNDVAEVKSETLIIV